MIPQISRNSSAVNAPQAPANVVSQAVRPADWRILTAGLTAIGAAALWFFYSRNEILLSGDAVAHINIARRVFDSRTPGLLQLGSVWLPLPHLLTIPFVINLRMWQSGIGGSVVSLISYVAATLGLFRLMSMGSRAAAWIGALVFALNPNLLYVQTTALNEPIYLATFIWATVFFAEAHRSLSLGEYGEAAESLQRGAIALTAAIFTRYDGWFLALVCWAALLPKTLEALKNQDQRFRKAIFKALLLTALGPGLWLAYNLGVYRNPLEFANGPYSARAIAQRTTQTGSPPYPGENHPVTASIYFLKATQLNVGDGFFAKLLVVVAALASVAWLIRTEWPLIALLWSPLVFYSLSIAYGSVPIFLPVWWPFSYYNVRYGLELLPGIAAGVGFSVYWMHKLWTSRRAHALSMLFVTLVLVVAYARAVRQGPICLRETRTNGHLRMESDRRLAEVLKALPRGSTILSYMGSHAGAFESAAFPLRQTINEGNLHIWDASLSRPARSADFVIATDGDPVANAVCLHPSELHTVSRIAVDGQPTIVVYNSSLRSP